MTNRVGRGAILTTALACVLAPASAQGAADDR